MRHDILLSICGQHDKCWVKTNISLVDTSSKIILLLQENKMELNPVLPDSLVAQLIAKAIAAF
jgi:hypothetical protein